MLGGWAVETGAVILLVAPVEDSVEGTVNGSSEGPFGDFVEESFGGCSVEASVKSVTLVLYRPACRACCWHICDVSTTLASGTYR